MQVKFVKCLLKGLENQISYIKLQYVNFIKDSITIISDFLTSTNLPDSINQILTKYYDSIIKLKPDDEEEEWNEDVITFGIFSNPEKKEKKETFERFTTTCHVN